MLEKMDALENTEVLDGRQIVHCIREQYECEIGRPLPALRAAVAQAQVTSSTTKREKALAKGRLQTQGELRTTSTRRVGI
jgi:hypothetical protein